MAIMLTDIYPNELTEDQQKMVVLAETALDALLQLHGYADVWLPCTRDSKIKSELHERYVKAGWHVEYSGAATSDYYVIRIKKPS